MRYLGLDVSQTSTGLALIEEGKALGVPILSKPMGEHSLVRNRKIIDEILGHVQQAGEDYLVTFEDYAYGKPMRMSMLAELTGQIKMSLVREAGVSTENIWVVSPSTLKKYILGHGRGEKSQILKAVYKKWDFDTGLDDIADAYGLARLSMAVHQYLMDPNKKPELAYEADCVIAVIAQNKLVDGIKKKVLAKTMKPSTVLAHQEGEIPMPLDPRIAMGIPPDKDPEVMEAVAEQEIS